MSLPENDYQILKLTDDFYNTYSNPPYAEIMKKRQRAYTCILFQTHYGYFICVPYRTEIPHKYAYHFKNSKRSQAHKSGLDYTKIVILTDTKYIDTKDALIDKDEYNETMIHLEKIKSDALKYVEDYIAHVKGQNVLHPKEFKRRYEFSPLKYFHVEMGI